MEKINTNYKHWNEIEKFRLNFSKLLTSTVLIENEEEGSTYCANFPKEWEGFISFTTSLCRAFLLLH